MKYFKVSESELAGLLRYACIAAEVETDLDEDQIKNMLENWQEDYDEV